MNHILGLKCTICGAEYAVDDVDYVCPRHGDDGVLDVVYDYPAIRRQVERDGIPARASIWRYMPLLPVDPLTTEQLVAGTVIDSVGWTPLVPAPRLAARLGLRHLWIKDDSRQPTASFKDRASAIAVVKARERNASIVTTASTGNAAAALAGLCAAVGQRNVILVPRTAPQAKVAQLLTYGSTVLLVDGTYDQAFDLCLQAARALDWYNRSTAYNPYMSEGKKTAAYEICEQLQIADRRFTIQNGRHASRLAHLPAPDVILVPVGDGCIIGGIHKGLHDLLELGWLERMPRLIGVQADGSSPLVDAWERGVQGWEMTPVDAHTVADSISAGLPRDRIKALRAVRDSGGALLRVSDHEILAAIPTLARACGIFAEPAAAAATAGLFHAVNQGLVQADERIVVLSTGSGLKDVASAMKAVTEQAAITDPTLQAVQEVLLG